MWLLMRIYLLVTLAARPGDSVRAQDGTRLWHRQPAKPTAQERQASAGVMA